MIDTALTALAIFGMIVAFRMLFSVLFLIRDFDRLCEKSDKARRLTVERKRSIDKTQEDDAI